MEHLIPLGAMLLGHLAHVLKKVIEERKTDPTVTLRRHLSHRPYKTALSVVGSLVGYIILWDTDQLTLVAAVGVGYMADSAFEIAASETRRKL